MLATLFTLRKLFRAAQEHRRVEEEVGRFFQVVVDSRYRTPLPKQDNVLQYLQKNFFSSLFLSIYTALEIPVAKRRFYGVVNHCIRGIVTGTDNLLDNEYKELLPFAFPENALRFKSVMHILTFDRILEMAVEQAVEDCLVEAEGQSVLRQRIFEAMIPIGAEEALEEGGVAEILSPAEILRSVHMYKGGKLLCLAFVAPLVLEQKRRSLLQLADAGVYKIGLALQVIDDITDLYEDIRAGHHNYLVSAIFHEGENAERQLLRDIFEKRPEKGDGVENLFPGTLRIVMARAIGEAVAGFAELARAGYWFQEKQALRTIRFLFQIRGVGHLLPYFPRPEHLLSLTEEL